MAVEEGGERGIPHPGDVGKGIFYLCVFQALHRYNYTAQKLQTSDSFTLPVIKSNSQHVHMSVSPVTQLVTVHNFYAKTK